MNLQIYLYNMVLMGKPQTLWLIFSHAVLAGSELQLDKRHWTSNRSSAGIRALFRVTGFDICYRATLQEFALCTTCPQVAVEDETISKSRVKLLHWSNRYRGICNCWMYRAEHDMSESMSWSIPQRSRVELCKHRTPNGMPPHWPRVGPNYCGVTIN